MPGRTKRPDDELLTLIRRSAASYARSLGEYWPTTGPNEAAERNISLHVGHALLEAGWAAFGEGHARDRTEVRFDLVALDAGRRRLVVGEFKRLFRKDTASAMAGDVARIARFVPQPSAPARLRIHGLVAATTWRRSYAEWFQSDDPAHPDPAGLDELWAVTPVGTRFGAEPLAAPGHWLVYALFPAAAPPRGRGRGRGGRGLRQAASR